MMLAELDLDLDMFQGPFDLLLALVLREEIEMAELPIAEIVVAYVERMEERGEIDLESATEFVVLVAALLEIKVRLLFGLEDDEEELTIEEAEEELIERLMEYRRYAASARWLSERATATPRLFRTGPAPLQPRPEPKIEEFSEDPWQLHAAILRLLEPPPQIDVSVVRRRLVPVSAFLDRFRQLLAERRGFAFEDAVRGLDRLSQAAAFLAVLELYKAGEADPVQADLFAPIRVTRAAKRREPSATPAEASGERAIA